MTDALTAATAFTRQEEGGYTADSRDSSNWGGGIIGHGGLIGSNMGVGAPALIEWMGPKFTVTAAYMKTLPLAAYNAIASARYYRPLACDKVPPGVALMNFDYGWNRGIGNAGRQFQEALALPEDEWDGDIGPATLASFATVTDLSAFINRLGDIQIDHYKQLSNFNIYGKGWLARSERRITAALAMLPLT